MKKRIFLLIVVVMPMIGRAQGIKGNVANTTDPRTIFLSSAATAFLTDPQFVAGYELYHLGLEEAGLRNGVAAVMYPQRTLGSFSLAGQYFTSPIYRTGNLSLGYGREIFNHLLSLGFTIGLNFISYAEDNFKLRELDDPVFHQGNSRAALDVGMSLLLRPFDPLYIGVGIQHLNQPDISLAADRIRLPMQYHCGMLLQLPKVRPSISLCFDEDIFDFQLGLERWFFDQRVMMRASYYRYDVGASAAFLIPLHQHGLRFEYEYRYPLSELSQISNASHLILLSYALSRPKYDFELVVEAASQSVYPGEKAHYRIDIKRVGNFHDPVHVHVSELNSDIDYSLIPLQTKDNQSLMLTISPSETCPPGDYPIQVIADSRDRQKLVPIHLRVKKRPALRGEVVASVDKLIIRETTRIFSRDPLLPYIFFEEGSAVLNPERYEILNPEQHRVKKFVFYPEKLLDIPSKYRNTLNVIAKRLWDHPEMEILVRGHNSDWGIEKGDLQLSRRRAEAVRDYLVKNCGVNPKQIKIEAQGLPPDPASNLDPRGRQENQRVEITCPPESQPILDPIVTETSEIASSHDRCRFDILHLTSEAGLTKWQLTILDGAQDTFKVFAGTTIENEIIWDWKNDLGQSVSIGTTYQYQLQLWDSFGQQFSTRPKEIQVERISEVAREYIQKNIEKTRLILFKYDRADMDLSQKSLREELELNANKLRDHSVATLLIQGHTDVIGDPDYNMRLSLRRAETVARYFIDMGISTSRITYQGFGMTKPLIDNNLPEGRMMNRRVEIFIHY